MGRWALIAVSVLYRFIAAFLASERALRLLGNVDTLNDTAQPRALVLRFAKLFWLLSSSGLTINLKTNSPQDSCSVSVLRHTSAAVGHRVLDQ